MSGAVPSVLREGSATIKPAARSTKRRWLYTKSAAAFRWIHIYVSMLSFASLMFFAFTGITLNHPTWLGGSEQSIQDEQGNLPEDMATRLAQEEVDQLAVAEWLRHTHSLKGRVTEFEVDEYECMLVYKSPGYSADVFIDRQRGTYMLTKTQSSLIAVLNDLHKGRDSGPGWAWLIDVSAVVMMLMSISGFGLLLYLKKRRINGVLTAVCGTIALVVVWALLVP